MHKMGIAHRDIVPQNILIYDKSNLTVKISDFSFALYVGDDGSKETLGDPLYQAPEIVQKKPYK